MLKRSGDLAGAEAVHLSSLRLKIESTGENSVQAASTKNALGEVYMLMGKMDEAEKYLVEAYDVRKISRTYRYYALFWV